MVMRCGACAPEYCACADFFGGALEYHQTRRIVDAVAAARLKIAPDPSPGRDACATAACTPGGGGDFLEMADGR
jgi:hypothetical protein